MLRLVVAIQAASLSPSGSSGRRPPRPGMGARRASASGQATAEYALVLLGVAAIALLVAAWATKSGKIAQLFDAVIGQLISRAK